MAFVKLNIKSILIFMVGIMIVQQAWLNGLFADDNQVLESRIKIIVKETNLVKKPHVFFKDIADIQANGFLKEALEKLEVCSSPEPGKIKSFDKIKLRSVIQGQRYLPDNIMIISPKRIYVKRLSQAVSNQEIRQFIDQFLSRVFKNKEYQLTAFSVRGVEPYPQGEIRFRSDPNNKVDKKGRLSFFLDVIIDGKKVDRVSVSGRVAVYANVLHTRRSYAKGDTISKENVYRKKENIFTLRDNFIQAFKEIDGKILKSSIRKGDYLRPCIFSDPPLIQKGDIITLIAKKENLLIVTSAISKEDGVKNELIKVENLNSGKLVRGIVKGKSKVEVVY
jgi:flagella basal body P-ring formation protein FlgA